MYSLLQATGKCDMEVFSNTVVNKRNNYIPTDRDNFHCAAYISLNGGGEVVCDQKTAHNIAFHWEREKEQVFESCTK